MQKIKHIIFALSLLVVGSFSTTVAAATPLTQFAATCKNVPSLLGIPAWYSGLSCDKNNKPQLNDINQLWVIVLNVLQAMILIAAYVAVVFIIWNGFRYIKSRGDPGKITEAKTAIFNAVIGLGIALASAAIVRFVQGLIR